MGSCTWTDSLVHYWLTAADDDSLRERLSVCLSSTSTDVTLACVNWAETSCDLARHSDATQLSLQVIGGLSHRTLYKWCMMASVTC